MKTPAHTQPDSSPLARLRRHVSGAITRGEKQALTEQPATQPAHTPTPWSYQKADYEGFSWRANIVKIDDGISAIYARAYGATIEEGEANAKFIVQAVNTYDQKCADVAELREALRSIIHERDSAALSDDPAYTLVDRTVDSARTVLARHGGGSKSAHRFPPTFQAYQGQFGNCYECGARCVRAP